MNPAAALTGALIHSLWQGTALALAYGAFLLAVRNSQSRYVVGLFTLVGQVAWPVATYLRLSATTGRLNAPETLETSSALSWVPAVWLVGVLVMLGRFVGALLVVRRWVAKAEALNEVVQARFERLRERLGVRAVQWGAVGPLDSPLTVGFVRPVVLLPASLLTSMPIDDLELIIAHELMHVRRWDYFVNLLQSVVEALLFFHPAMWWVSHRTRDEREFCCDDEVVGRLGAAKPYALALVSLEQYRQISPPLAVAATGGSFRHRIQRLLRRTKGTRSIRMPLTAVSVGVVIVASAALALTTGPKAPLIAVPDDLKPAMRQMCANIERTAADPALADIPAIDRATVVLATVNEQSPGLEAFYSAVAKLPPAQRLDTFKRSVSAAIGTDWQCAKFEELWNAQ